MRSAAATADIAELERVPIIHIRPDTRSLKTASARRIIPVHRLIRPAFLACASSVDHERLFPELSLDKPRPDSDSFQKWFSRFLDRIEARAPRAAQDVAPGGPLRVEADGTSRYTEAWVQFSKSASGTGVSSGTARAPRLEGA